MNKQDYERNFKAFFAEAKGVIRTMIVRRDEDNLRWLASGGPTANLVAGAISEALADIKGQQCLFCKTTFKLPKRVPEAFVMILAGISDDTENVVVSALCEEHASLSDNLIFLKVKEVWPGSVELVGPVHPHAGHA